jgi:predicted MPP superfamily phosphohydrolase
VAVLLEAVGSTWMGFALMAVSALLLVDVVTVLGLAWRARAPRWRGRALAVAALLSAVACVQGMRPPVVETHEVSLPGLPVALDGTTVVALSDLHLGVLLGPRWLAARVDQVRVLRPDLVLLLGDIVEGHGRPDPDGRLREEMARLSAPLGVWGVLGNHEAHGGGDDAVRFLEAGGVRVLRDAWREVGPGLVLAGVDDPRLHRDGPAASDRLERALAGRPENGATLLMSHRPEGAEPAAAAGVGLMLSGHTHGGQLWPFSLLAARRHPWFSGRYDVGGMTVLVSRGAGTWGPRMRLWKRADILRVVLRAADG